MKFAFESGCALNGGEMVSYYSTRPPILFGGLFPIPPPASISTRLLSLHPASGGPVTNANFADLCKAVERVGAYRAGKWTASCAVHRPILKGMAGGGEKSFREDSLATCTDATTECFVPKRLQRLGERRRQRG